ncbi:amidohydrolase family protein [Streptomyces sp. NPDC012616]|uniref:amidohydrolase family protein n=1 Tax=Streptomyces sp. NPDC012616 TaxID=3364840 RepID=UPI0036EA9290
MSVPTVDVHAHAGVPAVDALVEGQSGLARQRETDAATLCRASLSVNLKQIAELGPKLVDLDLRLAAMDAARVQVQAVSAVPLPHAWADRELATRIIAVVNEGIAALCAKEPTRLLPIGAVALQHPDLAVGQLVTAVRDLGMRGCRSRPPPARAGNSTTRRWPTSGRPPRNWAPPCSSTPGAAPSARG